MNARSLVFYALLLLTTAAFAQPAITAIEPPSGPAAGGTEVTIRGTGFTYECVPSRPCITPTVHFGARSVRAEIVSATAIRVTTPAHLPAEVNVSYIQGTGGAISPVKFTYTGEDFEGFERVLLPLLTPPVQGAFGSEFHTTFRATNARAEHSIPVFGLAPEPCMILCPPFNPFVSPFELEPDAFPLDSQRLTHNGTPGRFILVPSADVDALSMNLRVHDVSRQSLNFGTEMPIAREREFNNQNITLLGVPADARFRNTLRIYSTQAVTVSVKIGSEPAKTVRLTGSSDVFTPAFASVSEFPVVTSSGTPQTIDVEIVPQLECPICPLPHPPIPPIWAFVSVTNNETQLITTITPQP